MQSGLFDSWLKLNQLFRKPLRHRITHAQWREGAKSPSTFLPIANKTNGDIATNLCIPLPLSISHTLTERFFKALTDRLLMTSEWRHVLPISFKNKGARKLSSRVQFLRLNQFVFNQTCKLNMTMKLLCHVLKFLKFWKMEGNNAKIKKTFGEFL